MPGSDLLIGIATIAVAVAGFSGIAASLIPSESPRIPALNLRLRVIVSSSLSVLFESLLPPALFPALGDARAAIVVASGLAGVGSLVLLGLRVRQDALAQSLRVRSVPVTVATVASSSVLFLVNVALGSLSVYVLALGIQLAVAAFSFYSLVVAPPR